MDALIQIMTANCVAAVVLAALAAVVGRWCRTPALTHVLWLLVLVKLVTPPVVTVPLFVKPSVATVDPPSPVAQPLIVASGNAHSPDEGNWVQVPAGSAVEFDTSINNGMNNDARPVTEEGKLAPASTTHWPAWLLAVSAMGTVFYISTAALRACSFSRLIRLGRPAEAEDAAVAARLAADLRLNRTPRLVSVSARISPAVWPSIRGAVVVLPDELFRRLGPSSRKALLAHELAHIHRRDHWVRLFETAVTAVFWWHPIVWIARTRLREAEELCCDRVVLRLCRGHAREYATALVDTLDFLSGRSVGLPTLASGARPIGSLKRRIEMVMSYRDQKKAAWPLRFAALAAGVVLLSLAPAWADDEEPAAYETTATEVVVDVYESVGAEDSAEAAAENAGSETVTADTVIRRFTNQQVSVDDTAGTETLEAGQFEVSSFNDENVFSFFVGHNRDDGGGEAGPKRAKSLTITYDDGTTKKIVLPDVGRAGAVTVHLNLNNGTVSAMNVQSGRSTSATAGIRTGRAAVSGTRGFTQGSSLIGHGRSSTDAPPGVVNTRSRIGHIVVDPTADADVLASPDGRVFVGSRARNANSTEARLDRIEKVLEMLQKRLEADTGPN